MRLRQLRPELQRLAIAFKGVLQAPEIAHHIAEIAVCHGKIRLDLERAAVARRRLLRPPEIAQRVAGLLQASAKCGSISAHGGSSPPPGTLGRDVGGHCPDCYALRRNSA